MKYLGLLIAVVLALGAAFAVLKFSGNSNTPQQTMQNAPVQVVQQAPQQLKTVDIYIAARDIPVGAVIDENMLTTQPWPENLVIDSFIVGAGQAQEAINRIARSSFRRNEPINKNKLVNPADPNFLAGALPPGKRMVTIQTNEIAGVAGFIFPGDRVDVLATHDVLRKGIAPDDLNELQARGSTQGLFEEATEVLVTDVRILAVDQRASAGVDENQGIVIPRSVSLEVSPMDAQRIRLAEEIGKLSLTLRSIKDKEVVENVAITRESDLSSKGAFSRSSDVGAGANVDNTNVASLASDGGVKIIRGTEIQTLE